MWYNDQQLVYFTYKIIPTNKLSNLDVWGITFIGHLGWSFDHGPHDDCLEIEDGICQISHEVSGIVYIRQLHGAPVSKSTPIRSQLLYRKLLSDQYFTMQITRIAIFLFAAMGAVASPIVAESRDVDAQALSKYGGVSSSYEMSI